MDFETIQFYETLTTELSDRAMSENNTELVDALMTVHDYYVKLLLDDARARVARLERLP